MASFIGTGGGVDDILIGTKSADLLEGLSGDDLLIGGRGKDTLIGGLGNDVMWGGLDGDTFSFSAGHISTGEKDYVADFNIGEDSLVFLNSGGGQGFIIDSVSLAYLTETTANGHNLGNNVNTGTDVTFTARNSVTNQTMEIVLLDAWSGDLSAQWDAYLSTLGLSFTAAV
jgi:hypothetical protein